MTRLVPLTVVVALLGSPVIGQQAGTPLRPGVAGVRVPALVAFVAPDYPSWARVFRTQTIVTLDVIVGRDGRVRDVVVLQPPPDPPRELPLVDPQSPAQFREPVIAAVRQWTFDPASVAAPTVTVPVTVRFEMLSAPRPASFFGDATAQPPVAAPDDFEVVYSYGVYGCRFDTRAGEFRMSGGSRVTPAVVPLTRTATQREAIYREMVRVGFFEYGTIPVDASRLPKPTPPDARFEMRNAGIEVFVRSVPSITSSVQPSVRHTIEAWRGGTQKIVTWDDHYVGPAQSREMEGIRLVIATLQRVIQENDAVLALAPPAGNMCRAPL